MFRLFATVQEAVGDASCQLVLALMYMMDRLNRVVTYTSLLALRLAGLSGSAAIVVFDKVHNPRSRPLSRSIYENKTFSWIPDSRMHSPLFDTAFPDSLVMTTDERAQIRDRGRKGAFTVPWNWIEVCFRELTPAWRSVAVKTDSLLDRSLKFISASQGVSTAASSTAPLATWRVFAVFSFLTPPEHEVNAGKHDGSCRLDGAQNAQA